MRYAQCALLLGAQAMVAAASRLGWTLRPVLDTGSGPLLKTLRAPGLMAGPSGARRLELALLGGVESARDAERAGMPLAQVTCSASLLPQVPPPSPPSPPDH